MRTNFPQGLLTWGLIHKTQYPPDSTQTQLYKLTRTLPVQQGI